MIYILMGVSGCGKSTIGRLLAQSLALPFLDADDFHPQANIDKMAAGHPLSDEDRWPWLEGLCRGIEEKGEKGVVVACSALKQSYREKIEEAGPGVTWIVLHGCHSLLEERLTTRKQHFFSSALLQSQLETIEVPAFCWHFEIDDSPDAIVQRIVARINKDNQAPMMGIVGLGAMGRNLAMNVASRGWGLAVYNREVKGVEEGVAEAFVEACDETWDVQAFDSLQKMIMALPRPRIILLMVTSGAAVDAVIDELSTFIEAGDIVVDAGNSHFRKTQNRANLLRNIGVEYVGMGVSGGLEGARRGPSMMPGGSKDAYVQIAHILESIAAVDPDGRPCCAYVGPEGAGHFVKMVHNGIEYAEMQLLAECYAMLENGMGKSENEIADIFESWRPAHDSFLLQITIDILRTTNDDGTLILDTISDVASHKGTGRWTVEEALRLGVPCDTIAAALFTRQISSKSSLRSTLAGQRTAAAMDVMSPEVMAEAYNAVRLVNHAIGFDILRKASKEEAWELDFPEIARVWTGGCIIRSQLMHTLATSLPEDLEHLLSVPKMHETFTEGVPALRSLVSSATGAGIGIPVCSAGLSYLEQIMSGQLPTNLIQAQRDFFGAHGFRLKNQDDSDLHHANWISGDD